jgi:hypothetical protein
MFQHDSPYYSPLSSTAWYLHAIVPYAILKIPEAIVEMFSFDLSSTISDWRQTCHSRAFDGLEEAANEASSGRVAKIDSQILDWMAKTLEQDDDLEKFLETIPGFYKSGVDNSVTKSAPGPISERLSDFMVRTVSSKSVSEKDKIRRLTIGLDAATEALNPDGLRDMFSELTDAYWDGMLDSVMIGHFLCSWDKRNKGRLTPFIQGIITVIVTSAQDRNDRWAELALDYSGIPEGARQDYLTHKDNLALATVINFLRHADRDDAFTRDVIESLSPFNTRNPLPEIQRDFCALWNEIVREAQNVDQWRVVFLFHMRNHYISSHRGTNAAPTAFSESAGVDDDILYEASSYPLCNLPNHCSPQAHHVHEVPIAEGAPPTPADSFSRSRQPPLPS